MEIKQEIVEEQKELTKEQRDKFAGFIADKFKTWDEDRQSQINTAKDIIEEVYLNQPKKAVDKRLEWKSDVKPALISQQMKIFINLR